VAGLATGALRATEAAVGVGGQEVGAGTAAVHGPRGTAALAIVTDEVSRRPSLRSRVSSRFGTYLQECPLLTPVCVGAIKSCMTRAGTPIQQPLCQVLYWMIKS